MVQDMVLELGIPGGWSARGKGDRQRSFIPLPQNRTGTLLVALRGLVPKQGCRTVAYHLELIQIVCARRELLDTEAR